MLNTVLALLTVIAVMIVHALIRLLVMPFRLARGLLRPMSASIRSAAG